jgi:peptide/nickel transport system permease protein
MLGAAFIAHGYYIYDVVTSDALSAMINKRLGVPIGDFVTTYILFAHFVGGVMLILGLSLGAGLLPSGGWVPFAESPAENLVHMALPALTLAVSRAAVLGRLTRAAVLDTMHRSFVQYARAKGLGERAILFRHVLPNAAIPIVTVLGLQVGYMLGGAIVVEMIFTLPGLGRMTLDAVLERNYPVVQSAVLVIGAMFMLVNLVTDVLYGAIDPRVRRR